MTTAWSAVRPRPPIHHLAEVRPGDWRMNDLDSGWYVAVVSRPWTFEPWPGYAQRQTGSQHVGRRQEVCALGNAPSSVWA
jgi:hypothetical protein